MNATDLSESRRLELLEPPRGRVRAVLGTDTYNEIDDQFALAYALASSDAIDLQAVYAAPFTNDRSTGPADGMEKSYEEIGHILDRLGVSAEGFALRGSTAYLSGPETPVESDAAVDLIKRAHEGDTPLYVLAIGAITNVSSAILLDPSIRSKIVVVWLGGHPHSHPHSREFNLQQDLHAARIVFDSGVPLVQIPCSGVASHLITTLAELEKDMGRQSDICSFLLDRFEEYSDDHFGWGKVIWDISAVAWVIDESWVPTWISHSPRLSDDIRWTADEGRHFIRVAHYVNRNPVFKDMFRKLRSRG